MQTVSHPENSLILWRNTMNRSNVFGDGQTAMELLLAEDYLEVFENICEILKSSLRQVSFCKLWQKVVETECAVVRRKVIGVMSATKAKGPEAEESAQRIVDKFRGNLGEIFAEAYFKEGYALNVCDPKTYVPVDPKHERYVDADAKSRDGLPVGIQVKNYAVSQVAIEVFQKSLAENMLRIIDGTVSADRLVEYLAYPRQFIFSLTAANGLALDDPAIKKVVSFIGPKDIDKAGIQGDQQHGTPPNWQMFQRIVDEIKDFTAVKSV